jgi:hypothetical protein
MKYILIIFILLSSLVSFGQTPPSCNYSFSFPDAEAVYYSPQASKDISVPWSTINYALTYTIIPIYDASGGTGELYKNISNTDCGKGIETISNDSWITIDRSGFPSSFYTVAPNTGTARVGTITVNFPDGNKTATIHQASCGFSLSQTSGSISHSGGSRRVDLFAGTNCVWTAKASDSWITIEGITSGNGNNTLNYSIAPNLSGARMGTITVGGETFTINQTGLKSRKGSAIP